MTLQNRLKQARKAAKKTQIQVAKAVNITQSSYSELETGESKSSSYLPSIAAFLGVDALWLQTGEEPVDKNNKSEAMDSSTVLSNVTKVEGALKVVPVISFVQAGEWKEAITQEAAEYIYCAAKVSVDAFALKVNGLSMSPDFKPGEYIVVDPNVFPAPGDFVVAQNGENEATFKKYRPRGLNEAGENVFELVPINPDFPTLFSDRQKIVIIGKVVTHNRSF